MTQFNIFSEGFHAFLTPDNHTPRGNTIARKFHLFRTPLYFLTLLRYFKYEDIFSTIKNEYKSLLDKKIKPYNRVKSDTSI